MAGEQQFEQLASQNREILTKLDTLTQTVNAHVISTKGVVEAYEALQGAIKVGITLQNFALWCAKWGVIGTGVAAFIYWVLELPPPPTR